MEAERAVIHHSPGGDEADLKNGGSIEMEIMR